MRRSRVSCALVVGIAVGGCALDESGLGNDSGVSDVALLDVTKLPDASVNDVAVSDVVADAPDDDAADVSMPPSCNPTAAFGNITNLGGGVDSNVFESSPSLTSDELTIFFARDTGGGRLALFYATRGATSQPFGNATEVSSISSGSTSDTAPFVNDTLTTLYFASSRNSSNRNHLFQATGNGTPNGWSNVTRLDTLDVSDPDTDTQPWISAATAEIWFSSNRLGSLDIYSSPNTSTSPNAVLQLSTVADEIHPVLSHDGLTIFFGRTDSGGKSHFYVSTRVSTSAVFGVPALVNELEAGNSSNTPGWLSVDGCRMYFTSDRPQGAGMSDIWIATRGS